MKKIVKQMGFGIPGMIASMMPSRRLYRLACKALGISPKPLVENKRYTRTTLSGDIPIIQDCDDDGSWRCHNIYGPIPGKFENEIASYYIDGVYLGSRFSNKSRKNIVLFTRSWDTMEEAARAMVEDNPSLALWIPFIDEKIDSKNKKIKT